MHSTRGTLPIRLVLALAAGLTSGSVHAQGANIDLQAFRPALDSRGFITVNSPTTLGHGELSFGLVTSWGKNLLRFDSGSGTYEVRHLISPTLVAAFGLELAGLDLELAAALPFVVLAGDRGPDDDGGTPTDPNDDQRFRFDGQGLGDASLHLKARVLDAGALSLALIPSITGPTATSSNAWLGDGRFSAQLIAAAELERGVVRLGLTAGYRHRFGGTTRFRDDDPMVPSPTGGQVALASTLPFGAAVALRVVPRRVELVGEVFGAVPVGGENYGPLETIAGAKLYLAERSYLTLGGGAGLMPSKAGNPDVRAFLGIVFEPQRRVREAERVAPEIVVAEVPAPSDRDGDGILDVDDACPDDPEDFDDFEDLDGCPEPDNDGDGILDVDDLCPNQPETVNGFEDDDGCADTRVTRVGSEMVVLGEINFEYDSDVITPDSFSILDEVAQALLIGEHILEVEVQGHTDARGSEAYNLDLSQRRAASVVRYLSERGVGGERLSPRGYGESAPKVPGTGEAAWQANRRVEFHIRRERPRRE